MDGGQDGNGLVEEDIEAEIIRQDRIAKKCTREFRGPETESVLAGIGPDLYITLMGRPFLSFEKSNTIQVVDGVCEPEQIFTYAFVHINTLTKCSLT